VQMTDQLAEVPVPRNSIWIPTRTSSQ
jgi:hypothetical protein